MGGTTGQEEATPEQIRDSMIERFGQGTVDTVSEGVDTSTWTEYDWQFYITEYLQNGSLPGDWDAPLPLPGPSSTPEPTAAPGVENEPKTVHGFDITVNSDKWSKHIVESDRFVEGRSIFLGTVEDAQRLVNDFAGTGEWINTYKERVDFGEVIGQYVDRETGQVVDTTIGIIHYSKTGVHIVPAHPSQ